MKLLHVTLGYLPAVSWGGPVTVVRNDARELATRGYEITICASNRLDKRRRIATGTFERQVDGQRVVYLDTYFLGWWPGTVGPTFLSLAALRRLWREVGAADTVHAHGTRNALVMATALFSWLRRKPLILQPHGTLPHIVASIRLKKLFDLLFMRALLGAASVVVALQDDEVRQIRTAGGSRATIEVVPNGLAPGQSVSSHEVKAFRERLGVARENDLVLFLGRINAKKGVDLLVEALAMLPTSRRARTTLVIAGPDDGHLNVVHSIVREHGLTEHVRFTGLIETEQVPVAHAAADLFVLTCRKDTFPMALLEACQHGTPILVTDSCEIAGMIDGVAGDVVPVDVPAIASALDRLLGDDERRRAYSQGGRRLIQSDFSIRAVGDKLQAIYERGRINVAPSVPHVD